jgi:CHAT domain-containing protein
LIVILVACSGTRRRSCADLASAAQDLVRRRLSAEALRVSEDGLKRCSDKNQESYWKLRLAKGKALYANGQYDESLIALKFDLPASPKTHLYRASQFDYLGWVYFSKKDYDAAESAFHQAADEAQLSGSEGTRWLADIFVGRQYVASTKKEFSAADSFYHSAIRLNSDPARLPYLYFSRAFTLMEQSRYEEAAQEFERARSGSGLAGNEDGLARIHTNLGACYNNLGDFRRASLELRRAEPLLRKNANKASLQVCLNAIGVAYLGQGSVEPANRYLAEAAQLAKELNDPPQQADALANLASVAIAARDWTSAENYNRQALELRKTDPDAELFALLNRAEIMAGQNDLSGALSILDVVVRRPSINPSRPLDAQRQYIAIYRRQRDLAKASQHYRAARCLMAQVRSQLLDRENKLAYSASKIALNQEWVRLLVELNKPAEALDAAEASRALSMQERFEKGAIPAATPHTDYLRRSRGHSATLLSYWLGPDESYVWVVTPVGLQIRKLPGEEQIRELVESYRAILERNADPMHSDGSGDRLRAAVLDPVAPLLNGSKSVIIVPDGALHAINFEALPVNGHYWIDDVTLTLAPSLRVLVMASPRPAKRRSDSVFVLGDAQPTPEFPHLQKAAFEINAVSQAFAGRAQILRGAAATPDAYLSAPVTQNFIHFAAHADANAERPLDSAVILSPGKRGERLTARQLLDKSIRADLVTISACRSAGVRSYRGEGLVGFAWAFLQTGAHSVIAGLWNASDDSTSQIMSDLYARIARGETPPEALRHAKLSLVHADSHLHRPYYWAPFQYYAGVGLVAGK